jgi:lipopolysaccharide export system permease protein
MLKTYQKYIISNFFSKFFILTIIFFLLLIVLISLEEISFTKKLNVNFLFPYFLTLLNTPITLFEIFPFIFLITTQLVYYDFFKKNELQLFKSNGITNLTINKN